MIKFASYRSQTSFKKLPSFHKMSEFKESNDQLSPDFKSNEIHVKIDEVGRTVSLTFELVGEFHTMNRGYDEILEKTLHRFSITCRTKLAKTSNKAARASKKQPKSDRDAANTHAIPEPVLLMHEGGVCDASSTLNYQMKTGMTVTLDSMVYTIVVNPPTVTSLGAYPKYTPYVGCPIVPQIAIEFGDEFSCMWAVETASNCTEKAFTIVSTEKVFVPSAAHEGCRVKLFCCAQCSHTGRQGRAVVFYLAGAIQPGFSSIGAFNRMIAVRESFCAVGRASPRRNAPTFFKALLNGACSSQEEEKECAQELRGDDELRVVTYNILAEPFATSEQAYVTLYPYCDQALLQSEFRIQRVLAEIVACDADVLCLQECDLRTFEGYLLPLLGRLGYAGHFTCKGSTEGCAVFTYEGTCHVAARIDLPLKNVLREASYLENLYLQRPDLRDVLGGKLGTVAQLTVVQCVHRPDRALVIANTHLFYHPLASFLRAIQAYAITQALSAIKEAIEHPRSSGLSQDFISLVRGEETNQIMQDKQRRIEKTLFPGGWVEGVEQQRGEEEVLCGQAPLKASVIFCGDLNSSPNIAAMQFLVK